MTVRVLNMMGPRAHDAIAAAVPAVDVVDLRPDDELPASLAGDILFAAWLESPVYDRLDEIGVRWMHLPGTGIDSWPGALLEGRTVTCSRGVSAIPIAEFVLAAMLAFEKRIPEVWIDKPPARWNLAPLGELAGATLGLVGLGGIGTAIARRALGFDMRVVALRRTRTASTVDGVELAFGLTDLLNAADHLVLAVPATPLTHQLLDARSFSWVKPGVHLVNIARGSLIDQDALRDALDDGRVAHATLDCVEPEPLPEGHWLYTHPSVRLSAHVSWNSPRAFDRMVDAFVSNLRRYVAGEPLEGVVDVDEGY
ncbi:MAG: NAD(P)-dependent oxidoreductase [Acidimicrobiia bacterium]